MYSPIAVAAVALLVMGCAGHVAEPPAAGAPSSVADTRPSHDPRALEHLLARAAEEHSSCVLVSIDDRVVADRCEDVQTSAMSVTKALTSLAVGLLVDDAIVTLDDPVSTWFPEWRGTPYEPITVRQLLNHTSGLAPERADMRVLDAEQGRLAGDIEQHALSSPLVAEPGERFQYNNNAVDFLAVVVQRASGKPLDRLLDERIFEPLGIQDTDWARDGRGTPFAAGELQIRPSDLLAVGRMLAADGVHDGQRLVSAAWIEASTAPSVASIPSQGLLWRLLGDFRLSITPALHARWRAAGAPEPLLEATQPFVGLTFANYPELASALETGLGADDFGALRAWWGANRALPWAEQVVVGPIVGYYAEGWLGQYLVVIPSKRIVAVRMRAFADIDVAGEHEQFAYPDFPQDVLALRP